MHFDLAKTETAIDPNLYIIRKPTELKDQKSGLFKPIIDSSYLMKFNFVPFGTNILNLFCTVNNTFLLTSYNNKENP